MYGRFCWEGDSIEVGKGAGQRGAGISALSLSCDGTFFVAGGRTCEQARSPSLSAGVLRRHVR